ncbi:MAG: hypothetical protein JKX94_02910 [Sneathiella sp.]|nr:hypothetical protein [Sneathiella sp.]
MVLSTIVTKRVLAFVLVFFLPGTALAGGSLERIVSTVQAISPDDLPTVKDMTAACGANTLCAGRILSQLLGPRAILEKVRHPSSDRIRMVTSVKSIKNYTFDDQGVLTLVLSRFGRKVVFELKKVAANIRKTRRPIRQLILDLRRNPGGDVDRMLRVTSLFTGAIDNAVLLSGRAGTSILPVPDKTPIFKNVPLQILIGLKTKSSAEILAALLKVHANAQLVGGKTFGKNYLLRVIPVNHDWRLLVPAERVEIPGIGLAGGLLPDRPEDEK